jgi:AcrR family transcriptional regulator
MTSQPPERQSPGLIEILDAAAHAFAEHGYHGMSMRDLAKATKRSPATLYNYVDSKEDLLYLIQRDAFDGLLGAGRAALADVTDPDERLHRFVLSHVQFFAEKTHLMRLLIHEASALPPKRRSEIRERKEAYFELGRGIVRELARRALGAEPNPQSVERCTYILFGTLNWIYGWYEPQRHGDDAELARAIESFALHGISGPSGCAPQSGTANVGGLR